MSQMPTNTPSSPMRRRAGRALEYGLGIGMALPRTLAFAGEAWLQARRRNAPPGTPHLSPKLVAQVAMDELILAAMKTPGNSRIEPTTRPRPPSCSPRTTSSVHKDGTAIRPRTTSPRRLPTTLLSVPACGWDHRGGTCALRVASIRSSRTPRARGGSASSPIRRCTPGCGARATRRDRGSYACIRTGRDAAS